MNIYIDKYFDKVKQYLNVNSKIRPIFKNFNHILGNMIKLKNYAEREIYPVFTPDFDYNEDLARKLIVLIANTNFLEQYITAQINKAIIQDFLLEFDNKLCSLFDPQVVISVNEIQLQIDKLISASEHIVNKDIKITPEQFRQYLILCNTYAQQRRKIEEILGEKTYQEISSKLNFYHTIFKYIAREVLVEIYKQVE